jgi:hypothetical protein
MIKVIVHKLFFKNAERVDNTAPLSFGTLHPITLFVHSQPEQHVKTASVLILAS